MKKDTKAEVLAPASNFETVKAALNAGADAIYIGGSKFGARAYADNMKEDELRRAIDYAHLHEKKIYMTINTLLKQEEIENELYEYLRPYYEQGLDAAIVQDLGVMEFIRNNFQDLSIHASTQMTITGQYMPKYLENIGVKRIVTARELSFEEIKAIHEAAPNIEIESFVHGALCMGYSGMCFFSSFLGERSGNRGRCAQICRLPYCLLDREGREFNSLKGKNYLLSPKDICTVEILPEIIESGVYSLKIEGRMKRIEYIAGVTAIYRKYVDLYYENGKRNFKVSKEDLTFLAEIYNRGGFSKGYYNKRNGIDMMSLERPNHYGVYIGKTKPGNKGFILEPDVNLNDSDAIEIRNDSVFRIKNVSLLNDINDKYIQNDNNIPLQAELAVQNQKPIILKVLHDNDIDVMCSGPVIETAKNQSATEEQLIKNLKKTGETEFEFTDIKISLEENCFVPVKVINELRRNAIDLIREKILSKYRRNLCIKSNNSDNKLFCNNSCDKLYNIPELFVNVSTLEQLDVCISHDKVTGCYIDMNIFNFKTDIAKYTEIISKSKDFNKIILISLPVILRKNNSDLIMQNAKCIFNNIDGVLVHNAEQLMFIRKLIDEEYISDIYIVSDYMLYAMNSYAVSFLQNIGVKRCVLPVELTKNELLNLADKYNFSYEIIFYGYLPMMFTAQCQQKNVEHCTHKSSSLYLRDRKNKLLHVRMNCNFCYNTIYNSAPFSLFGMEDDVKAINCDKVRIHFTNETSDEANKILDKFTIQFYENKTFTDDNNLTSSFTRGHFKRGVE